MFQRTPAGGRRTRALGEAIRAARAGISQTELGEMVGRPQSTVSTWEAGLAELSLEQVVVIEEALRLPPGHLIRSAGYLERAVSTTEARR